MTFDAEKYATVAVIQPGREDDDGVFSTAIGSSPKTSTQAFIDSIELAEPIIDHFLEHAPTPKNGARLAEVIRILTDFHKIGKWDSASAASN